MQFCSRCNKTIYEVEWRNHEKHCQNCYQLFKLGQGVREVKKQLSPEILVIWRWPTPKTLIPDCEVYMYDILMSNLYFSPEGTDLEYIEYILNSTPVNQRITDYHTRELFVRNYV
jgi:hypothetical protein